MSKFTAWPWIVDVAHHGQNRIRIIDKNDDDVVRLKSTSTKSKANAHLIAAAPELYWALKMMLESHDRTCKGEECQISGVDFARSALKRARGEG